MGNNSVNGAGISNSVGYHFSRFRRKGWRRLCVRNGEENLNERAEFRRLKLMGLYYMGVLLMIVGFIICFNAVFRTPSVARPVSAAITTTREGAGY